MIDINKKIDGEQIELLKEIIGKRLNYIEYVDVIADNTSWNTIRLHFDGISIDINSFLEMLLEDDKSGFEEYGIISVTKAPTGEKLRVNEISSKTSTKKVSNVVESISTISETIKVFDHANLISKKKMTKAIILNFNNELLAIDRQIFYEEVLTFKFGKNLKDTLHDDSDSWQLDEENNGISFDYSTENEKISN